MRRSLTLALRGAIGCLIAALLGELFLDATRQPPAPVRPARPPQALSLLIDCSGSMKGSKVAEVKDAAVRFARRQDLEHDRIAVVAFESWARVGTPLTSDPEAIERAIARLDARDGSTAMDFGLATALATLRDTSSGANILLFTDGEPDEAWRTVRAAAACRDRGVRIVAVATGDADTKFLAQLTGDPALVFHAHAGNYGEGFRSAERAIYGPPIVVESSAEGTSSSFEHALLRTGGWTALLALGIALALISGQNKQVRRRALSLRQACVAIPGSLVAGLVAGAASQLIFLGAVRYPALEMVGRMAAWVLLGALLGRGMAYFVLNLRPRRALLGGALGGAVGAAGFLWAAGVLSSDIAGRLSGAASLGFFIGLMIALVEVIFRDAWLEIGYGPRESSTVTLGDEPVTIGSDEACTVWSADAPPVAFRFRLDRNRVVCENVAARKSDEVKPGHQEAAGKITVTVRSAERV